MKKVKLYANSFTDEKNTAHRLEYFLLIRSAEQGKIYGIEITKTDAAGNMEKPRRHNVYKPARGLSKRNKPKPQVKRHCKSRRVARYTPA